MWRFVMCWSWWYMCLHNAGRVDQYVKGEFFVELFTYKRFVMRFDFKFWLGNAIAIRFIDGKMWYVLKMMMSTKAMHVVQRIGSHPHPYHAGNPTLDKWTWDYETKQDFLWFKLINANLSTCCGVRRGRYLSQCIHPTHPTFGVGIQLYWKRYVLNTFVPPLLSLSLQR